MSVYKELYEAIEAKIATISSVKHFGKWNNQILNTDSEWQYEYPAVFLEFSLGTWSPAENKPGTTNIEQLQKGEVDVSLHIITFSRDNSDNTIEAALDLSREIWTNVNGLKGATFTTLQRALSIDDDNHDERRDWIEVYTCTVYECPDEDGQIDATLTAPGGVIEIEITGDFDPNPFTGV